MALVPLTLRPSFIVRRNALRKGVLGPSALWKVVAVVVFGRGTLKRLFGRTPEVLGTRRIGVGHVLTVAASVPLSRREARRAGISTESLAAEARAELEAAQQAP
jgi:hypothetical protein